MIEVVKTVSRPTEGRFAAIWTAEGAAPTKNPALGLDIPLSRSKSEMLYALVLNEMEDSGIYPRHTPRYFIDTQRWHVR